MQLLTMKELMAFLKVKRNTVYELRRQGLPVIHLGRSVRFDQDEVIAWVRSNSSSTRQKTEPIERTEELEIDVTTVGIEVAEPDLGRSTDFLL